MEFIRNRFLCQTISKHIDVVLDSYGIIRLDKKDYQWQNYINLRLKLIQ